MTSQPADPNATHVPEYQPPPYPEPEPEFIDLTDAIEPGEPGYRDPDSDRLSGILMKIDRLLSMTNTINQEAQLCR